VTAEKLKSDVLVRLWHIMCTCSLLSNAISDLDCIVLNDWMISRNEFERVCKGIGVMEASSYGLVEGAIMIQVSLFTTYYTS